MKEKILRKTISLALLFSIMLTTVIVPEYTVNAAELFKEKTVVVNAGSVEELEIEDSVDEKDNSEFKSCRLIVFSNADLTFEDASKVTKYEDKYFVTYNDVDDTKAAYNKLVFSGIDVEVDIVNDTPEDVENKDINNDVVSDKVIAETNEEKPVKSIEKANEEKDIVVAVLDTGLNVGEDIFNNKTVEGRDFTVSEPTNEDTFDYVGHGTLLSRLILDTAKDDRVKIMPLKVLNEKGKGTTLSAYKAIKYAIEKKVDVINISMSGVGNSKLLESAINEAVLNNISVVVSAGNDNKDVKEYTPANIDSAITVGSAELNEGMFSKASYSNYGNIDYVANGNYEYIRNIDDKEVTTKAEGTSISAAYVTSYISMIKMLNSEEAYLTYNDVIASLDESAIPIKDTIHFGRGYLTGDNLKVVRATEKTNNYDTIVVEDEENIELEKNATGIYAVGIYPSIHPDKYNVISFDVPSDEGTLVATDVYANDAWYTALSTSMYASSYGSNTSEIHLHTNLEVNVGSGDFAYITNPGWEIVIRSTNPENTWYPGDDVYTLTVSGAGNGHACFFADSVKIHNLNIIDERINPKTVGIAEAISAVDALGSDLSSINANDMLHIDNPTNPSTTNVVDCTLNGNSSCKRGIYANTSQTGTIALSEISACKIGIENYGNLRSTTNKIFSNSEAGIINNGTLSSEYDSIHDNPTMGVINNGTYTQKGGNITNNGNQKADSNDTGNNTIGVIQNNKYTLSEDATITSNAMCLEGGKSVTVDKYNGYAVLTTRKTDRTVGRELVNNSIESNEENFELAFKVPEKDCTTENFSGLTESGWGAYIRSGTRNHLSPTALYLSARYNLSYINNKPEGSTVTPETYSDTPFYWKEDFEAKLGDNKYTISSSLGSYTHTGWGEKANDTTPKYSLENQIVGGFIGHTGLFALYNTEQPTAGFDVIYDAVDAKIDGSSTKKVRYDSTGKSNGKGLGYTAPTNIPEGKEFVGWYFSGNDDFRCKDLITDLIDYVNRNDDLKTAFGYNALSLFGHFWEYGQYESTRLKPEHKIDGTTEGPNSVIATHCTCLLDAFNGYDFDNYRQTLPAGVYVDGYRSDFFTDLQGKTLYATAIYKEVEPINKDEYGIKYIANNGYNDVTNKTYKLNATNKFEPTPSRYVKPTAYFDSNGGSPVRDKEISKTFIGWDSDTDMNSDHTNYVRDDSSANDHKWNSARYLNANSSVYSAAGGYDIMYAIDDYNKASGTRIHTGNGNMFDASNFFKANTTFKNMTKKGGTQITMTGRWKYNPITLPTLSSYKDPDDDDCRYYFRGWEDLDTGIIYPGGATYTPTSDNNVHFRARWNYTWKHEYFVQYYYNNGWGTEATDWYSKSWSETIDGETYHYEADPGYIRYPTPPDPKTATLYFDVNDTSQYPSSHVSNIKTEKSWLGWYTSASAARNASNNQSSSYSWWSWSSRGKYMGGEEFKNLGNTYLHGAWKVKATPLPTPTRPEYDFLGWEDSNGNVYPPGSTYTASDDEDMTFIAIWRRNCGQVNYKPNGATTNNGSIEVDGQLYDDVMDTYKTRLDSSYMTETGAIFGDEWYGDGYEERKEVVSDLSNTQNSIYYITKAGDIVNTKGSKTDLYSFQGWSPISYAKVNGSKNILYSGSTFYTFMNIFYDAEAVGTLGFKNKPSNLSLSTITSRIVSLRNQNISAWNRKVKGNWYQPIEDNGIVDMYATWDKYPVIETQTFNITSNDLEGLTENSLRNRIKVVDEEDGTLGKNSVQIIYDIDQWRKLVEQGSCYVSLTVIATDSVGNSTKKVILIGLNQSNAVGRDEQGYIRLISREAYNKASADGGVINKSIWVVDEDYKRTINENFDNLENDTPEQKWNFTHDQVLEAQEYIKSNGLGKTNRPNALNEFYDRYRGCLSVNRKGI